MKELHVCWLVDDWKPTRDKYIAAWQRAGWRVNLWTLGQCSSTPSTPGLRLYDARSVLSSSPVGAAFEYEMAHRSHAAAADLFRFAVLFELGGAYADLDVLPRDARPATSAPLFGMPQGAGKQVPVFQRRNLKIDSDQLEIRFVASPENHPLIARVLDTQAANERRFIDSGGYAKHGIDRIVARTGPVAVERVVRDYAAAVGVAFRAFLLKDATLDRTPENEGEHMTFRYPEIIRAAHAASVLPSPSSPKTTSTESPEPALPTRGSEAASTQSSFRDT